MTAVDLAEALDPGVYDLTDEEYFADPVPGGSLSSTGVRQLLSSPARFRHTQLYGRIVKREFDVGHGAHALVLGSGPELVEVAGTGKAGVNTWATNADKELVAKLRAEGKVPLRPSDYEAVHAMAEALQAHPLAPKLFARGCAEQTLIWRDEATGVMCRAKTDWLRPDGVVDYKTCDRADEASLAKAVHNHGYYIQAPFYLRGFRALHPGVEPFFAFVAQEKEPPYLVHVFQLKERAMAHGDRKCTEALELYARCQAANDWPGYPHDITDIDLPAYVRTEEY